MLVHRLISKKKFFIKINKNCLDVTKLRINFLNPRFSFKRKSFFYLNNLN